MTYFFDLNLKRIQYFLSIVKEGGMSNAAKVLYVSQPLLSKNIKELEQELHVTLFVRENKQLRLTDAGKYLYEQWDSLIKNISVQIETAQNIEKSKHHQIHFGCEYLMSLGANDLWVRSMIEFQKQNEDVSIIMSSLGLRELKEKLTSKVIDLMLCSNFDAMGLEKDYHVRKLCALPVYLYGRCNHPILSKKEDIQWSDLKNCEFYTILPEVASWPEELLMRYTQSAGYRPHIAGYTETQMSQVLRIKTGDCVMLSLELKTLLEDELLCARKMQDETTIVLVWRKGEPILDELVDFLVESQIKDKD